MSEHDILKTIRRKTRLRFAFALVILVLYFSYLLNYLPMGDFLSERLGASPVTGSLAMFAGLIVSFIALELLFLALASVDKQSGDGQ